MNTSRIDKILKGMAWPSIILAAVVAVASIAYAAYSVFHLFSVYVQLDMLASGLAVLSSVGMAIGLLLVVITTDNQNARGMGSILMLAWVLLTLAMVGLDSFMRTELLVVPESFSAIGRVVAALLPALSLAGIICMALALHDHTPHKSAAGASSRYVGFAAKFVGVGASGFASYYFGVSRGIDPILAVLCAALLESSFLWSYLALKAARDRGDRFDVGMWSFCTLLFGLFIAAVSVETLSHLGRIEVPIVKALGEVGATLYVSAVGLTILLTIGVHLLTKAIDDVPGSQTGDTRPFAIKTADQIRATRAGFNEIKGALREPARPALPAGTAATMAADSPLTPAQQAAILAAVMKENERLAKQREPVKGKDYDATGEVVNADAAGWPTSKPREAYEHISEWWPLNSRGVQDRGNEGWELVSVGDKELHQTGNMSPSYLHTFRRPK